MYWNTIIDATIIWAFSLPKLAIIALLKRILDYGKRTTIVFWTLGGLGQAFIFSVSVFAFAQCKPVAKNWDSDLAGSCAPLSTIIGIEYFASTWSAALDLLFALYPAPFIMRLNMPLKTRLAVCAALSLGVLASVIQGYKLSIMGAAFEATGTDPTCKPTLVTSISPIVHIVRICQLTTHYIIADPIPYLNTLGMSESCLLLIAGSLPALGPLLRTGRTKLSQLSGSRGTKGSYSFGSAHRSAASRVVGGSQGYNTVVDDNGIEFRDYTSPSRAVSRKHGMDTSVLDISSSSEELAPGTSTAKQQAHQQPVRRLSQRQVSEHAIMVNHEVDVVSTLKSLDNDSAGGRGNSDHSLISQTDRLWSPILRDDNTSHFVSIK
ncbi:hypothetical protein BX600DRAFT_439177 [Xylariales sp. PMI_506]|nr:hypothetical protein BX600DRAFT_439177 [Xylariales sp. PMI_506]